MDYLELMDKMENELYNSHSLAALIVLINMGRELDFEYNEYSGSITHTKDDKYQLADNTRFELFDSVEELIVGGKIYGKEFLTIWNDIKLGYLY